MSTIDWARLAVPQDDGYDTAVLLRLAAAADPPLRKPPFRRRGLAVFGPGGVTVSPGPERGLVSDHILPAPIDHPNLGIAAAHLEAWPGAYAQFRQLIDTVHPYTDPAQAAQGDWSLGSSSHSPAGQWGCIHVTVDDPLGLAQALIHETAHQKLHALGIEVGQPGRLITNDPAEGYHHPLLSSRQQPMTAVFHEQYTFVHVVALNLHMYQAAGSKAARQRILMLLARNVVRTEEGHEIVARHLTTDRDGTDFVGAFMAWAGWILTRGRATIDASGYGFMPRP